MIDCFEVSEKGIRRVSVPLSKFYERVSISDVLCDSDVSVRRYWNSLAGAQVALTRLRGWPQNPRVAPRTGVGVVMSESSHGGAA